MFESVETYKIIQYIEDTYGGEPEFLWANTPTNAVFRHKDTLKWFAAILNISKNKLGAFDNSKVDVLDLKCDPILIGSLRDYYHYFPAYHMNKEHWITILIDEQTSLSEVFSLIDLSFNITKKL